MTSKIRNKIIYISIFVMILGFSFIPIFKKIQISNQTFSCLLRSDYFTLEWVHSVELSQWQEKYKIKANEFILYESIFKTFGAGTPDTETSQVDKGWILVAADIHMTQIHWIVSHNVKSTIKSNALLLPIYQFVEDYDEINFKITNYNLWDLWSKNCANKIRNA